MELKYLNTFKTILEVGSFTKAARKLNYTQSTVTFQIQQLEQELSAKLFEKIGREMVITQAGRDVLPYIDTIIQTSKQLKNYGKETRELTGTLKVAMAETLLTYQMQPLLKAFREQAPLISLSLQALNCYTIRDQIIRGGTDIGIHYDVGGYSDTLTIEKLKKFPLALIASPVLDDSLCDFITPQQRKSVCLITSDRDSVYQGMFENYLEEHDIVLGGFMELGSTGAIKRSVTSNLGIAFLPRYVVSDELENGIVKELKVEMSNAAVTAICTYHKNKWISPAIELFLRLLKENI
jgi:DNA-binding transcriptional LysR family regulator